MTTPLKPSALRRHRILTAAAALAAAALILAGCTSDDGAAPTDGSIGGKLTYWAGLEEINDESIAAVRGAYVDPFTALFPDVDVEVIPQNAEGLGVKVQTALAAGLGPDLVETPGSSTAIPYAQAGYLADLGGIAEEEGWADEMLPWALDMGVIDGELVAIPVTYETLVVFYNTTLFDEKGWDVPTDGDSLRALIADIVDAGVTPYAAGNSDYVGATEHIVSAFLNQVAGPGNIHDALAGDIPFTDDAFVDAIQEMVDQFQAGWFGGGVEEYFSTTDAQRYAQLVNGEAAMMVSGSWEIYPMNEYFGGSGSDWDWFPLPSLSDDVPTGLFPLSVGGTISINSATKNLPAAEAYLKWKFSDTEANWNAISTIGDLPLPVEFDAENVPEGIDERFVEQYIAISDASLEERVGYVTWTSFGGAAEAYILENEDKLLTGALSAEEFCQGLADAYDEDVADGVIPPLYDTTAR